MKNVFKNGESFHVDVSEHEKVIDVHSVEHPLHIMRVVVVEDVRVGWIETRVEVQNDQGGWRIVLSRNESRKNGDE